MRPSIRPLAPLLGHGLLALACAMAIGLPSAASDAPGGPPKVEAPRPSRAPARLPGAIVVTDFGVVGDGVTDVTAPLQQLINKLFLPPFTHNLNRPGQFHTASYPQLVFPAGTYVLSDMVVLNNHVRILGEDAAVLRQTNPQADVFYVHWAHRVSIENLTFEGGRRALKFWTHDIDRAVLSVSGCTFRNTSDYAIENIVKSLKGAALDGHDDGTAFRGFYRRDAEGRWFYDDDPDAAYVHNSTLMTIEDCRFENCAKVLHGNVDWGLLRRCEIDLAPSMQGAAILNAGILQLDQIQGRVADGANAAVAAERRQIWIDHLGGLLIARRLNLRRPSGGGIPVVLNRACVRGITSNIPYALFVSDSVFGIDPGDNAALVSLREVPNQLVIENCRLDGGDGTIELLRLDAQADLSLVTTPRYSAPVFVAVGDDNPGFRSEVPAPLLPFKHTALPGGTCDGFDTQACGKPPLGDSSSEAAGIDVASFGAVPNDGRCDRDALQKALVAAASTGARVLVPNGIYHLSAPLALPPTLHVEAVGRAVFIADKPDQTLFQAERCRELSVRFCTFIGGRTALDVRIDADGPPATVRLSHCFFKAAAGDAVRCLRGSGQAIARPMDTLWIDHGVFTACHTAVRANADSRIEAAWISTHRVTDADPVLNMAVLSNSGRMACDTILGVPIIHNQERDYRWIDNAGTLVCDFIRFGGEYGGMNCVNLQPVDGVPNRLLVQRSWLYGLRNTARRSRLYFEGRPDRVVLRNNSGGLPDSKLLPTLLFQKEEFLPETPGWLEASGNLLDLTPHVQEKTP
ncbi:MAG: glycosyl hydrolase family 28-related protein [Kiritimatiellia bacterium]|jgi:hypothetical protein